jgi:hypothetical protein
MATASREARSLQLSPCPADADTPRAEGARGATNDSACVPLAGDPLPGIGQEGCSGAQAERLAALTEDCPTALHRAAVRATGGAPIASTSPTSARLHR